MKDHPVPAPASWPRQAAANAGHPPVTVEIVTQPPHPVCLASIVVGHDTRSNVPLYSLHVDHQTVYLTSAQLAAVLLAACQLVKPADLPETVQ